MPCLIWPPCCRTGCCATSSTLLLKCPKLFPPSGLSSHSVGAVQHVSCAIALTMGGVSLERDTCYNQLLGPGSAFWRFQIGTCQLWIMQSTEEASLPDTFLE